MTSSSGCVAAWLRRNAAIQSRYDTRVVGRTLWPLELSLGSHQEARAAKAAVEIEGGAPDRAGSER